MRLGLDSRLRPTAEICNDAISVEENTSYFEPTKIIKFLLLDLLHNVCVEGLALAHEKPQ